MKRIARLSQRDWRVLDRVFASGLLAFVLLDTLLTPGLTGPRWLNVLVYTAAAGVLFLRRSHALVAALLVFPLVLIGEVYLTGPESLVAVAVLVLTAAYSVGAHEPRRRAFAGLAVGVACVSVTSVLENPDDIFWPVAFFCVVPWLVGRALRSQSELARELAEKADRAEHAREHEERRAIAAERARIARELHDVLAHNLSVMVVQAGAAARIVEQDPDTAADAAHLIRTTGRDALVELRSLLGPVHRDEMEPLEGVPSLKRIDRLVRRAREAGLTVKLSVEGEAVDLPTGVDLTAYRVIQEALTNTIKHAGDAQARVSITYEPWEVVVEVEDDGVGPDGNGQLSDVGGGHGLVGMRERVHVYGGLLQAGRRRGGGFAVRARLPRMSALPRKPVA
jgi:signal transduction histidine kinase